MFGSLQSAESGPCCNAVSLITDATNDGTHQRKKSIMKSIVRILAVVAVAAAFVFSVSGDDVKTGKGKGPVVIRGENVLMTCPQCKDDYALKLTKTAKGTAPEKAVVGTHLCGKCNTKLTTKGAGKAKTEVAEHTCKGCS
jgi:hypothetical protein